MFVYKMFGLAQFNQTGNIFILGGNVIAFDSTIMINV